jgi:hypothetical protein
MPNLIACWRNAPTVLFITLEILTTGVLDFECAFKARWSALVQAFCFPRFLAAFFAIKLIPYLFGERRVLQINGAASN